MGSVKDLEIVKKPTETALGVGRFRFSDRYSAFDWGEMPDRMESKGAALCMMGAFCFERLEEKGINTHYRGVVSSDGKVVKTDELEQPVDVMEVKLVNVYRPSVMSGEGRLRYDYSTFTPNLRNYLIPIETVYRNGLPEGSSVFDRLKQGELTIDVLGLDHYPTPGERLTRPLLDVSTKLEEADRHITWETAQRIAGLTAEELEEVKDLVLKVDRLITQIALRADLENEDGKVELAFDPERRLMVVDVVGTLDECRFTYKGLHVSKEIARQYYRKVGWYDDVEEAKRVAEAKGIVDWRTIIKSKPPKLNPALRTLISQMYMAAANELVGRRLFEASGLDDVVEQYCREWAGHA